MTILPIPFRARQGHVSEAPALPSSDGSASSGFSFPGAPELTTATSPGLAGEGGVPAPLTPEQVQATIWTRDNPVANYLADEFCALLESNVYVPMTPNRKATVLAAMQSWVANLALSYDVDWAENADDETHADSLWIESLVDEAVAR